jgi:hypothetical protein
VKITSQISETSLARRFRKILLEAADYGLAVFGERVHQAIYDHIERRYQIRREEIPEHLETFQKALEGILGRGSKVVEKLIAKHLYDRLDLNFCEHPDWTLLEYVRWARK